MRRRLVAEVLMPDSGLLCSQERYIMAGLLLSNCAFVVAACALHALGRRVLYDRQLAYMAAIIFCMAPASIFFSSVYSESLYAAGLAFCMGLLVVRWSLSFLLLCLLVLAVLLTIVLALVRWLSCCRVFGVVLAA